MSQIHKLYNLVFLNRNVNGKVLKTCDITSDSVGTLSVNLSMYLVYFQFPDDLEEECLPEINNALAGIPFEDISIESIRVSLDAQYTTIEWYGRSGTISTLDFKNVLEEYLDFLNTSPLNGTKV